MKVPRFVAGLWLGASITGFLAAAVLSYVMTNKYMVPSADGVRLVDDREALEIAKQIVNDEEEENL